jgi:hypothetical protein
MMDLESVRDVVYDLCDIGDMAKGLRQKPDRRERRQEGKVRVYSGGFRVNHLRHFS